jgi:serine/threonine protein kinase
MVCPSCSAQVAPDEVFCPSCGLRLDAERRPHPYIGVDRRASTMNGTSLTPGYLIGGRYRVDAPIAVGAMGAVWRGRDERLHGRPCAIKAVRFGGATVEDQRELNAWFARESALLSSLHHPAICDIRDVVDEADAHYLVLELVEGRTLADELAARGAPGLPETEVLAWAATLCDALTYLHGHTPPVIFRDLKPQNIIRRPDGRVTLIDFGIARAMAPTGGTAIGTGGYAPPEQYQGLADARSDVYGLAATLHHLLTGRDPTRHSPFVFPTVRSLVPTLSTHVDAALARALSMSPDGRFPTATSFAAALAGVTPAPLAPTPARPTGTHGRDTLHTTDRLDTLIASTRASGTALPHILFVGPPPPGLLINHVAEAAAVEMGVPIEAITAHQLPKVGDLVAIMTNVQVGTLLFIDDINTLHPAIRSTLHSFMADGMVDFTIGKGTSTRTLRMGVQPITIVGGLPSRRSLTSDVASYFAEHINVSTLSPNWQRRVDAWRASPPPVVAQGQHQGLGGMATPPSAPKQIVPTAFKAPKEECGNDDKLFVEATKVVRTHRRATIATLQRHLSVSDSQAAYLLRQMEDQGIVRLSADGLWREVLDTSDDTVVDNQHVSEDEDENNDKLFAEATKAVREYRRASVSLLQRRLSIGYSRAARLLDQLEDRGVVGPSEDGLSRVVLDQPDDPALNSTHAPISASAPSTVSLAGPIPAQGSPAGPIPTQSSPPSPYKTPSMPPSPQPPPPRPGQSIQVSARILTWPTICACCSRPATTDVAASYTRVSGKRVVRTNTRSWRVPVCATCAEHSSIYSRTTGATVRAIAWSVAVLVIACVLGAAVGNPDGGINPTFVVLGAIGAVALLIVLLKRTQDDQRTAEGMLQDTCCSVAYPVVYQGWSGSVHSFYFLNGVYAQAFASANAKKVL